MRDNIFSYWLGTPEQDWLVYSAALDTALLIYSTDYVLPQFDNETKCMTHFQQSKDLSNSRTPPPPPPRPRKPPASHFLDLKVFWTEEKMSAILIGSQIRGYCTWIFSFDIFAPTQIIGAVTSWMKETLENVGSGQDVEWHQRWSHWAAVRSVCDLVLPVDM